MTDRRNFLKSAAGAAALAMLPPNLRAVLARPRAKRSGTIAVTVAPGAPPTIARRPSVVSATPPPRPLPRR